jgi:SAM-dependent methyltransferase
MSVQKQHLRDLWEDAARADAQWFVLTDHSLSEEQFYKQGRDEIAASMAYLEERGLVDQKRRALDFGCGLGRLSVALADYYEHVDGVDIAQEMVDRARPHDRVSYHRLDDLWLLDGDYDLIYSDITLQHNPSVLQEPYVKSFIRLLSPEGIAVFDITAGRGLLPSFVLSSRNVLAMWNTDPEVVGGWVREAGGVLVESVPREVAQPETVSMRYIARRV